MDFINDSRVSSLLFDGWGFIDSPGEVFALIFVICNNKDGVDYINSNWASILMGHSFVCFLSDTHVISIEFGSLVIVITVAFTSKEHVIFGTRFIITLEREIDVVSEMRIDNILYNNFVNFLGFDWTYGVDSKI